MYVWMLNLPLLPPAGAAGAAAPPLRLACDVHNTSEHRCGSNASVHRLCLSVCALHTHAPDGVIPWISHQTTAVREKFALIRGGLHPRRSLRAVRGCEGCTAPNSPSTGCPLAIFYSQNSQ